MAKEIVEQPSKNDEKLLSDVIGNSVDYVEVRGKRWPVRWVRNIAKRYITEILLSDDEDYTKHIKCVAVLRLERWWKIKFFLWILWRYYAYVKEYTDSDILPYLNMCKKKVGLEAFLINTTLLTEMKDTMMAMTKEEVDRILLAQASVLRGTSQKSTSTSPNRSGSSVE